MGEGKPERARSSRRPATMRTVVVRIVAALLAIPALYLMAALIGSLVPVNRGWTEAKRGIPIYLADNGIHTDIIMPMRAQGLDWAPLLPPGDSGTVFKTVPEWVAFGSGEQKVYLETPTWWDITPSTIWAALTGSRRVMHVEWVTDPSYAAREVRLRPEEYRRLWAAVRSDFLVGADGKPVRIDHPGYGCCDSFYRANGTFNALMTCNTWVAERLHSAGIETSFWSPFVQGLVWRYRKTGQST